MVKTGAAISLKKGKKATQGKTLDESGWDRQRGIEFRITEGGTGTNNFLTS